VHPARGGLRRRVRNPPGHRSLRPRGDTRHMGRPRRARQWQRLADADRPAEPLRARAGPGRGGALQRGGQRADPRAPAPAAVLREVTAGQALAAAMTAASAAIEPFVPDEEREPLARILSGSIVEAPAAQIRGSGYVVHCLEASLWCAAGEPSYERAVLAAINLG